ncbi:MAG TPA: 30S ribosomal protein S6 [Thermomicrobiales bacterium]|nr:30S ribosomal protein S6 [Thermomicrobiales bacterium]
MVDYPREPRNYELMVILLPELADEALTGTIDRVSGYVTNVGAEVREVLQDSPWGRRRLAYTIRFNGTDYRDGYYVIWHFSSIPSALGDLERDLKLDTSVIRHLLVIEDPKWGSPQEREAVREAANAPAEVEGAAAVAEAEDIVAEAVTAEDAADIVSEADVVEEAVEVAEATEADSESDPAAEVADEPAAVAEAAPASDTVEVVEEVQPDPVEEQTELVQTTEVAEEATPVEDTAEVAETPETEATEEKK